MLVRELFGKKIKDLTSEELKEYKRRLYDKRRKSVWEKSYSRTTYGKTFRKLSIEEKREYNRFKQQEYRIKKRAIMKELPKFEDLDFNAKGVYTIYNKNKILVEIDTTMITPQIYLYAKGERFCWNFSEEGYASMSEMFFRCSKGE